MRQIISFIVASSLLVCGALIVFEQFRSEHEPGDEGAIQIVILMAGGMIAAGGAWLWNDFVRPRRDRQS